MKKYFVFLLALTIVLAGCSDLNKNADNQNQNNNTGQRQGNMPNFEDNFDIAEVSELVPDARVMVIGTANEDGSIAATQIVINNQDFDFKNMMPSEVLDAPGLNGDQNQEQAQNQNQQKFNRPDFANMSDEQRDQMKEQFQNGEMGNRPGIDSGSANGGFAGSQSARVNGIVMNFDDTQLTLKIDDSGSKIIFVSDLTKILKPKPRDEQKDVDNIKEIDTLENSKDSSNNKE